MKLGAAPVETSKRVGAAFTFLMPLTDINANEMSAMFTLNNDTMTRRGITRFPRNFTVCLLDVLDMFGNL